MQDHFYIRPVPLHIKKPWGGKKLKNIFGVSKEKIGESLIFSTLEGQSNFYQGEKLAYWTDEQNFLVKWIDTNDHLSIQVHPNNDFAKTHENSLGKDECWLIVDAEPKAGIYLGLKEHVSPTCLRQYIQQGRNLSELMNFIPVKPGDFFVVPAGSLHAIGKGILLLEIQQKSGLTYRVWDWNRLDENGSSRKLHIEKAMQVINFEAKKNNIDYFFLKKNLFSQNNPSLKLLNHPSFKISLHSFKKDDNQILSLSLGQLIISFCGQYKLEHSKGDYFLSPFQSVYTKSGNKKNDTISILAKEKGYLLSVSK